MEQKAGDRSMVSFNINSLFSTFQYIVDLDGWQHPEVLSRCLATLLDPLALSPLPDAYTPQVCSNLRHLLESFVERPFLLERLEPTLVRRLLALLQRYCHICHVFLPDDEQLALHMKVKHSLPPHVRFVPLSPAFLSALHAQCVAEYHLLCPKESFYTSR